MGVFRTSGTFFIRGNMIMQKWLMTNRTGLLAAAALSCGLAAGLFVTIAQMRCTLLEEDVARLKGRVIGDIDSFKDEQEANHKAVLAVVNDTVKRVAAHLEEAKQTPEKAEEEPAKDEPKGGFQ
jgi:hypothetical protein